MIQASSMGGTFGLIAADIIFTNLSCDFQRLLSINHHVIYSGDFNTGVFFIRNHPWSIQFLDDWFASWPKLQHTLGQEDQALVGLLLDDRWSRYIYALPRDQSGLIASYPRIEDTSLAWHPGHCILHVAGFSNQKASILYSCLNSMGDCVKRLNKLYVDSNGLGYLFWGISH